MQHQSLQTNVMKASIEKSDVSPMCRMCNAAEETAFHIVSECRVHAHTEYKGRHDKLAKVIHWDLCKKYGVKVQSKWYDHVLEKVEETDHVKILWDFNIQTDDVIKHRRPYVVVLDKHEKMCHLIDIAVLGDSRVVSKENEKVQKYQDLARELHKLWQVKVKVIPVVVGETSQGDRNICGQAVYCIGLKFWPVVALVSLSKTLNHNCFVLQIGRKAVRSCVLCSAHKRTSTTLIVKEKGLALVFLDSQLGYVRTTYHLYYYYYSVLLELLQKAALLGTASILRKTLEI